MCVLGNETTAREIQGQSLFKDLQREAQCMMESRKERERDVTEVSSWVGCAVHTHTHLKLHVYLRWVSKKSKLIKL